MKTREIRDRVKSISTDYTETLKSIIDTHRAAKDEDTRTAVGLKSAIIANNIVGHLHISHEVMKTILSKLDSDPEFLGTYSFDRTMGGKNCSNGKSLSSLICPLCVEMGLGSSVWYRGFRTREIKSNNSFR